MKFYTFVFLLAETSLTHAFAWSDENVCSKLASSLPGKVAFDPAGPSAGNSTTLATLYNSTQSSYWNEANTYDRPACMIFPSDAEEVSSAIKIIEADPFIRFGLKSGGHNFNYGYSSVNGGVLISFRPNMQEVIVSEDRNTAEVGPGARWIEVLTELEQYGRAAVGGRYYSVGVGGYVILGGLSYLTGQYGFACDNVADFEVVLANGTITNANATHNAELYFALRGGGNNFGIVTKYTLLAHPIGMVWSDTRIFTDEQTPKVLSAITNFIANYDESYAKSALLPTITFVAGSNIPSWSIFMVWDDDGQAPPSHIFGEFFDIEAAADDIKISPYTDVVIGSGFKDFLNLGRTTDRVGPLPNLPHDNMTEFLEWHVDQAKKFPPLNNTEAGLQIWSMAMQPIPTDLQKANAAGGERAFHTDPSGGDKLWIEYTLIWKNASVDAIFDLQLEQFVQNAEQHQKAKYIAAGVKPTKYECGDVFEVGYNPLFANDGQNGQLIYQSFGAETYARLGAVRREVDPELLFQRRTGGFHLELPPDVGVGRGI